MKKTSLAVLALASLAVNATASVLVAVFVALVVVAAGGTAYHYIHRWAEKLIGGGGVPVPGATNSVAIPGGTNGVRGVTQYLFDAYHAEIAEDGTWTRLAWGGGNPARTSASSIPDPSPFLHIQITIQDQSGQQILYIENLSNWTFASFDDLGASSAAGDVSWGEFPDMDSFLEYSDDLVNWQWLTDVSCPKDGTAVYYDQEAPATGRFYRSARY